MGLTVKEFLEKKSVVLDVRSPSETALYSLKGSLLIPLNELFVRLSEIPKDKEVVVVCRTGNRSSFAVSLLREKGFNAVNLEGGLKELVSVKQELGLIDSSEARIALLRIG